MRRLLVSVVACLSTVLLLTPNVARADGDATTVAQCLKVAPTQTLVKGKLTIATDNPVTPPWFVNNQPSNQKGFESALAYALASTLGFTPAKVNWVTEHFATSFQPGAKPFDFDINEITVTPDKLKNVAFSNSYFQLRQSVVALKGSPIVKHHTPKDLRRDVFGALTNSPALAYVTDAIEPDAAVRAFATLNDAVTALRSGAIDAIVVDTPTGNVLVNWQILSSTGAPSATQVGQFLAVGNEYYGLLFQLKNPLLACVNTALGKLSTNGTLTSLTKKWLSIYTSIPTLQP